MTPKSETNRNTSLVDSQSLSVENRVAAMSATSINIGSNDAYL